MTYMKMLQDNTWFVHADGQPPVIFPAFAYALEYFLICTSGKDYHDYEEY